MNVLNFGEYVTYGSYCHKQLTTNKTYQSPEVHGPIFKHKSTDRILLDSHELFIHAMQWSFKKNTKAK